MLIKRCAGIAVAVVLTAVLAGCGGDGESDLPKAEATTTASPSPSPSWEAVPAEPPTAPQQEQTAESAEAFVPFAVETARYTLATGDADPYFAIATGACVPCANIARSSAKDEVIVFTDPVEVTTGDATIDGDRAVVPMRMVQPAAERRDKASQKVTATDEPVTVSFDYQLQWKDGSWRVAGWTAGQQ